MRGEAREQAARGPHERGRQLEAGVEVDDAVRRLLVQAQAEPAVPLLEVQADARAPSLLRRRHHLDRVRPRTPRALERLAQDALLQPELLLVVDVLVRAAAAGREEGTGRVAPVRRSPRAGSPAARGRSPCATARHARAHPVAGNAAGHEHDLALVAREAQAAVDTLLDREVDAVAQPQARSRPSCGPGHQSANRLSRGRPCALEDAPRDRLRADLLQHAFGHAPAIAREVRVDRRLDAARSIRLRRASQSSATSAASRSCSHGSSTRRGQAPRAGSRSSARQRRSPPAAGSVSNAVRQLREARRRIGVRLAARRERALPALARGVHLRRAVGEAAHLARRGPRSARGRRARPRCRAARCAAGCRRGATCG